MINGRRGLRAIAAMAACCALSAGCGISSEASSATSVPPPIAPPVPAASTQPAPAPPPTGPEPTIGARATVTTTPEKLSRGWRITVYYTPVESFHGGPRVRVKGCPAPGCAKPEADLGSYPKSFVEAVRTEGAGRITSGPHTGRYLAWSRRVGHFWLDDIARDAVNRPLRPWVTAAADRTVLERGSRFVIVDCGTGNAGRPIPAEVCERFRQAYWEVVDVLAPGYGGEHHADVYIGEETEPDFTRSPFYTTLNGAVLGLYRTP
ncbi:hypothetical protein [Thermomonospora catenispora]|uniref:hypothetical protein n=1 Tax=Thermomonospora catenispora TaxID=2493090 RepID=UPI001F4FBEFA|nr:hypothetical protein [Thermomonospora catenispora]